VGGELDHRSDAGRVARYLVALARERHFARAAEACGVAQPTLSEGIKQLEDDLGVPIVDRRQRYQGLTPAGTRVLAWAHRIIADYESLAQEVGELREGLAGKLTLAAIPATHLVVPLLTTPLIDAHPRVSVMVLSQTSAEIARAPKLKLAITAGIGSDHVDLQAAIERGLTVANDDLIAKMKRGAYLVNTARGKICDRDAIVRALESGQLAGYAGDVWFPQPAPQDHPWRSMPHHGMTPHISGTTLSAQARYAAGVREILECWFADRPIRDEYLIVSGGKLAGTGAHSYSAGNATGGSAEAARFKR
jgi:molybdenum-dependent DNA-binding transcriptional regulator ModE